MAVISQYSVVTDGQTITAALWNAMELHLINDGLIPTGIEDASAADADMQATTDPYPGSAISRPTDLLGEIKRLRYLIAQITGETYWYIDPDISLATVNTNFNAHTHDAGAGDAPQIPTAGIENAAVTADKIAAAVAGNGLAGGAGTALSVNVDNSTIEINSDSLRVKDSGITSAKISSVDWSKITNTTKPMFAVGVTTAANVTGDGTNYQIPGGSERYDTANEWSGSTFTASVTGKYHFDFLLHLNGLTASHTTITLYATEAGVLREAWAIYNTGGFAAYTVLPIMYSYDISLTATNTVIFSIVVSGGTKVVDTALGSISGHLIG